MFSYLWTNQISSIAISNHKDMMFSVTVAQRGSKLLSVYSSSIFNDSFEIPTYVFQCEESYDYNSIKLKKVGQGKKNQKKKIVTVESKLKSNHVIKFRTRSVFKRYMCCSITKVPSHFLSKKEAVMLLVKKNLRQFSQHRPRAFWLGHFSRGCEFNLQLHKKAIEKDKKCLFIFVF